MTDSVHFYIFFLYFPLFLYIAGRADQTKNDAKRFKPSNSKSKNFYMAEIK